MKPIVIFIDAENNKISCNRDEFKKICEDIYNQGYNDGRNSYYYYYPYSPVTITSDDITIKPSNETKTSHDKWWEDMIFTCQSNTATADNSINISTESNDCIKGSRFDNN